jgi:uncharacterized protein (TIGR03066 family)
MRVAGLTWTACAILVLTGCTPQLAKTPPASVTPATHVDMLTGTWEATKGEMPAGSTLEFTADGKTKLTIKTDGKGTTSDGTYLVQKEQIALKRFEGAKEVVETLTIKTLAPTSLVTEDTKSQVQEFSKK